MRTSAAEEALMGFLGRSREKRRFLLGVHLYLAVKVPPSPFRDRPAPALTRRRPALLKVRVCFESCGLLRSQDGRTFADVVSGASRKRAATSAVAVEPKASRKVKESDAGERRHISSCMAVQL